MRTHITRWIIGAVLLTAQLLRAQTADQFVTDGRAFLAQRNLTNAHLKFAAAVVASPNHENANAFVSVTRLLNLVYQPPAQNFLTRLGVSSNGRDVYHWNTFIAKDTNRVPVAPVGVSGAEVSPFWRTNALPEITNALANLTRISNTNFLLNLTSNDTTTAAVTVDYGDLLMLRAGLHFMEYFSYTLLAHDLDAQLTAVRALYTNHHLNIERLLADHPQLLAFATTNDMATARAAFVNFADRYASASDFLRARPAGVTRMFNLASGSNMHEQRFRQTLADLKTSLNGATVLSVNGDYTFFAGAHFSGRSPLHSFLPQFRGHRTVLGTLPDPTFGGLLIGHREDEIEDFLLNRLQIHKVGLNAGDFGRHIGTVPSIPQVRHVGGVPFGFTLRAQAGRGYVVQASTNLVNWENVATFIALSGAVEFTETAPQARRFYRVVDQNKSLPVPANNDFANGVALVGSPTSVMGYNRGASPEAGENYGYPRPGKSVWYSWTAPASATFVAEAKGNVGFYPIVTVATGSSVAALSIVAGGYGGLASFSATAGQVYRISVDGSYYSFPFEGGFKLTIGQPPTIAFTAPANYSTFAPGSTINLQINATDPDGTVSKVELQDSLAGRLAVLTNAPFNFAWANAPQGNHNLTATATDNSGLSATAYLTLFVPPANDMFTNRTSLTGGVVQVSGLFAGSSREAGEPSPFGARNGSVWFEWTAPSNGSYVISANSKQVANAAQVAPLLAAYTHNPDIGTNSYDATNIYYLPNTNFGFAYTFTRISDTSMRVVVSYPAGASETSTYVFTTAGRGTYTATYQPTSGSPQSYFGAFSNLVYGISGPPATGFAPTSLNGVSLTIVDTTPNFYDLGILPGAFIGLGNLPSQTPVNAQAGNKYFIALEQFTHTDFDYLLAIFPAIPPVVSLNAPTNGSTLYTTSSIPITATASDPDGTVVEMRLYVDGILLTNVAGNSLQTTLSNLSVGSHNVEAVAKDNSGAISAAYTSFNIVQPPPPNDLFANATVISGGSYSATASNRAGSMEGGEPYHAGYTSYSSVWWTWTAPKSGTVTVGMNSLNYTLYGPLLGIYTGNAVNSLSQITSGFINNYSISRTFTATAGTTYRIAVASGYSYYLGEFTLTLNQP